MLTCQQHCGDKGIFGILISVPQPFHPTATISQGVKGQNLTLPSITDAFFLLAEMDSSFPLGWKMVAEGTVISISCMELTRQIQTNIVLAGRVKPSGVIKPLSLEKTYHVQAPKHASHVTVCL